MSLRVRDAQATDAAAIADIYNQGIAERTATFEMRPRTVAEVQAWFDGRHPIVVVEESGGVIAFAGSSTYRSRDCYTGVAEFSVYVHRQARGRGAGHAAMEGLIAAAEAAGFWKLLSRVFTENAASRRLLAAVGFREVGVYRRHGRIEGVWKDCVIVERLLGAGMERDEAADGAKAATPPAELLTEVG